METVLILGYRKGLIRAVEALGLEAVIWDEKPIPAKSAGRCRHVLIAPFGGIHSRPESLDPALLSYQFRAVIALKEKAVVMAALLRQWWSIPGITLDKALRCHDKKLMKEHARKHHLPITDFCLIDQNTQIQQLVENWNYPVVVKPRHSSGRRGLVMITEGYPSLPLDHMAEQFIYGEECSVESFIVDGKIVFSNITQYYRLMHANILPADFPEETTQKIIALNERVISAFQITRGMTHVEFFLSPNGIIFGELAIRPPGGYIMNCLEHAYETSIWTCFLQAELNESFPTLTPKAVSASWILHPGAGTVREIHGWDHCCHDPNVIESKIRISIGDSVSSRIGVGEDVGRILLKAPNYSSLEQSLINIEKQLQITCD